jgi:nucleoside-diphosphate-sugar epimerase
MITILGASGFVGSHLVNELKKQGKKYFAPSRNEELVDKDLGDVIYCIGLTADFRTRPFETIEAHVTKLSHVLKNCDFNSLTYLSSTRLYIHNNTEVREESLIPVCVNDPSDLFNASKLVGELLALNCGRKNIKIARLSNVYGNDFSSENFITSIIKDAINDHKIILHTTPDSAKDYIGISDVVELLLKISLNGKELIYNLASGINTTNDEIVKIIQEETGCSIEYSKNAKHIVFPRINIDKIQNEFINNPLGHLRNDLKKIINNFKESSNLKK